MNFGYFGSELVLVEGPNENIWSSPCISDLSMIVVDELLQARGIVQLHIHNLTR